MHQKKVWECPAEICDLTDASCLHLEMSLQNTVVLPNGEILTGRLWRKGHILFKILPFYSKIPRMDNMAVPLNVALEEDDGRHYGLVLLVSLVALFRHINT